MKRIIYRKMYQAEAEQVSAFVERVFNEFVSSEYSREGINEFMNYILPDELAGRNQRNHFTLIAEIGSKIIGLVEVRDYCHISLLFVDASFQRGGVGSGLLSEIIEICQNSKLELSQITVNASPNSITAYKKMGFKSVDTEQCVNGIRFTPMALSL